MDKNIYTDNFERMLREKSDEFKMIPSKRVWHSIYNDLHPSRRWPSIAMSLFLVAALLITGYLNTENADRLAAKNKIAKSNTDSGGGEAGVLANPAELSNSDALAKNNPIGLTDPNTRNSIQSNQVSSSSNHRQATTPLLENNNIASTFNVNQHSSNSSKNRNGNVSGSQASPDDQSTTTKTIIYGIADPAGQNTIVSAVENGTQTTIITPFEDSKAPGSSLSHLQNNSVDEDETNNSTDALTTDKKTIITSDNKTAVSKSVAQVTTLNTEEKAWMDAVVLYNKPAEKKWKGKLSWEGYLTPSLTFRKISNNSKGSSNLTIATPANKPSMGLEAGAGLVYAFAKNVRFKTGLQFNYTNYNLDAWQTNHPVLTTVTMNDPATGFSYNESRSTSLTTLPGGIAPVKLHSNTYQVSAVAGFDLKLLSTDNLEWFAAATVQPSFVLGGKAYLISSDHYNYVADNSMLRRFNVAGGFETFVSYKQGNYSLQLGPQLRYQFMSTYKKMYSQKENLINAGIKVGIIKML